MTTPAVMFQGTGSDVGKSLIVAGLCRAFARRGVTVRPFKPQNMSNNAAVVDGGEIGRAQALQARAAGVAATVHMNPVLLKPQSEVGAQVVLRGQVRGNAGAREYQALKATLLPEVLASFGHLSDEADLILVEGAGSPAEINLRAHDIANMGFAEAADLPVVLIGDIDRGGVIASLCGTCDLLPPAERRRIKGFLVNKFRGDISLFDDGMMMIAERTGVAGLGVVPWFVEAHRLPAEDAMALDATRPPSGDRAIRIAVPRFSRIANFDDLDPLRAEPDVAVSIVAPGQALPGDADLVILPGSKATIADLHFCREQGWDIDLAAHLRRGGAVLGLCAGYQMLGRRVCDPDGIEGAPGEAEGLGFLEMETVLTGDKALRDAVGTDVATGAEIHGYEMHMGRSAGPDCARPMLMLDGRPDGAISADGKVRGCYVHGLFAADAFRHALLGSLKARRASAVSYDALVDQTLDHLADHLEHSLDVPAIREIAHAGA